MFASVRTSWTVQTADEFLLKGIPSRSDIGFLTLFEHFDYVKVGEHYKLPRFPIWVVCSESHYSVFFAASGDATPLSSQLSDEFDLLYFDGCVPRELLLCTGRPVIRMQFVQLHSS